MVSFQNNNKFYTYLWLLSFYSGICLIILNFTIKNDRSIILGILGVCMLLTNIVLCFCKPMREICCRESIFDHHLDLINERINIDQVLEQHQENGLKVVFCEPNIDNETDSIPFAKEINIINAKNIQIV